MAIPNSLIVEVQNEPRDGDIVYLEKDFEAFKKRIVELDLVEADVADEVVELGQTFYWDDESATIIGYEVQFPYPMKTVCVDCFPWLQHLLRDFPKIGSHMVVNFVAKADCECVL